eukprot:4127212-Prymnesium_polylepis.1
MVVAGDWSKQEALCLVHFAPALKRDPELLINFIDYGFANISMTGISVESLSLPLQIRKSVYEDTPHLTKIKDVVGFSPIKAGQAPWSIHLKPCLAKQPQYKTLGISAPADFEKWLKSQVMADRVTTLERMARSAMEEHLKGITRQDKSQGEKQKAIFEAKLTTIMTAIAALPPSSYDLSLAKRITRMTQINEADRPEWLASP